LYHALARRVPFGGGMPELKSLIEDDLPSPRRWVRSIPRDVETICLRCLEKDPGRRYPTAQALADDLQRFLRGELITARPIGLAERSWRHCRRRPVVTALAAALVLALFCGASAWAWSRSAARRTQAHSLTQLQGDLEGIERDLYQFQDRPRD